MDDVAEVTRIADAAEAVDGASPLDEAARIALADGAATVVVDRGGFALLHDGDLSLAVQPNSRGRGVGTALLEGVASYDGALVAWSHGDHPAAARLATAYGWERVRDLWVMRRPTSLPLSPLELPDGLTIRSYDDSDADAIVAVNAAAFASHPEQGAMDRDNLARRMAEPWFDPAGLLVAEDGSGVLGFHWTKQHDERLGEVYVVGVSPQAQGRGLGKLLTLAGLHHLAGLGVEEVLLYVESDNGPAVAVYSRLGFAHADADTHVQYRRGVQDVSGGDGRAGRPRGRR
jgi:mycothiol synthase